MHKKRTFFLLAILLAFALVAAACGDDDDDENAEGEASPTPAAETGDDGAEPEPDGETTETDDGSADGAESGDGEVERLPNEVTGAIVPLTGEPLDDPSILERPAIIVKMDNSPDARPQVGINDADMVVELLVEGITRLAPVFHSAAMEPMGPVRSGRSSDPDIAANFNQPLFAWSGGNTIVRGEIAAAEQAGKLYDVGVDVATADYYREDSPRVAPHNLFVTSTDALWARAPQDAEPPTQIFRYRQPGVDAPLGEEVAGIEITWRGGLVVDYVWDENAGGWARFQRGTPHVDGEDVQATPPNVVIIETFYGTSQADSISPLAVTTGEGVAKVLTGGKLVVGRWERQDPLDPWKVTRNNGEPILLAPGQTWFALSEAGNDRILTDDEAAALLP